MAEYSVIIPSNSAKRLRRCLGTILGTHGDLDPSKIIVVNDGVDWKVPWDEFDSMERIPIMVREGISPFIWARNVNLGIESAGRDDVIIMGDDVTVKTPGAFDKLAETAQRMNVAVVSPGIVGLVGNPHQRHQSRIVRESPVELCFVCVYVTREWIDRVGPLDERFVGYGGEDVDWSWRAQEAGGRLLVDGRAVVAHNEPGMESAFRSKPEIHEMSRRGEELLREKWPQRYNEDRSRK